MKIKKQYLFKHNRVGIVLMLLTGVLTSGIVEAQHQQQADKDLVVLKGATVIDGTGAAPRENETILIEGNEIVCTGECNIPQKARVLDFSGKYIMPGLIDLHVHYSVSGWVDGFPGLFGIDVSEEYPYEKVYKELKENPGRFHRSYLCSGVTTVFEPGGFSWGFQIEQGTINSTNAPLYITVGPLLTSLEILINHTLGEGFSIYLKDEDTARNAVRMLNWKGSEWAKVHRPDLIEDRNKRMQLLNAISEEARKAELSLVANSPTLESAKDVLRAGASLFIYPVEDTLVDQEFLQLAKQNNLVYTPAFEAGAGREEIMKGAFDKDRLPLECVDPETRSKAFSTDSLPPSTADAKIIPDQAEEIRNIRSENFKRIHEAGIDVAVGSSSGAPLTLHGPATVHEMKAMVEAGLTPKEAIIAGTRNGARALGLENIGTIEPGKRANMLILTADPLEDISNIRQVEVVVKNGKIWQRDLLEYEFNQE